MSDESKFGAQRQDDRAGPLIWFPPTNSGVPCTDAETLQLWLHLDKEGIARVYREDREYIEAKWQRAEQGKPGGAIIPSFRFAALAGEALRRGGNE